MSLNLLITNDYLISPAVCSESEIETRVDSLISLKKMLQEGKSGIFFEDHTVEALHHLKMFPCKGLFETNIRSFKGEPIYSGADIAKVVNNILSLLDCNNNSIPECLAEWEDKTIEPQIDGVHHCRKEQLESLVEKVSISENITKQKISLLHHPLTKDQETVEIKGKITNFVPEIDKPFPLDWNEEINAFTDLKDFICEMDSLQIYNCSTSLAGIKAAIESGALRIIKNNGKSSIHKFSFGENFLQSLNIHQCSPNERFANTAFDAICHVVAGVDKYEINPFYSDVNSKKQITSGDMYGWRTHITKGNPALRLMFWSKQNEIIFANIGTKKELSILKCK